jgi:hypothetical protein
MEAGRDIQPSSHVRSVSICLGMSNPLSGGVGGRKRAEFDVSTGRYYAPGDLDYYDWVDPDWTRRLTAIDRAVGEAVNADDRLSLEPDLRAAVTRASKAALVEALKSPPAELTKLKSVYLNFTEGQEDQRPGVGFEPPAYFSFGPWTFIEVAPSEVFDAAARYFPPRTEVLSSFRLYRRAETFSYREAWSDGGRVFEHSGICGEPGDALEHVVDDGGREVLLRLLRDKALARGYAEISIEEQRTIVASRKIAEMGTDADLELRYELQEVLDDALGVGCVGHCDGGATGSGSMEVFCFVVDIGLGMAVFERVLADRRFRGFKAALGR